MDLYISDIHGNINNLKRMNPSKYDTIFFLGDLFGTIDGEDEVINFVNNIKDKLICTKGNCDYSEDYQSLGIIPNEYIFFNEDGINIYASHGNKYSFSKGTPQVDFDILIYGHEHIPYINRVDNKIYICVGSVSRPRNSLGATYMEYEKGIFTIYDFDNNLIDQIKISS